MDKGIKRKNNDNTNNEDNITDNNKIKKSKSNLTNKENDLETESLRILEFFCGIGGMVKFWNFIRFQFNLIFFFFLKKKKKKRKRLIMNSIKIQ